MLIHCASSNRVGGLWAAYPVRYCGYGIDEAIRLGGAAGRSRQSMIDAAKRVVEKDEKRVLAAWHARNEGFRGA